MIFSLPGLNEVYYRFLVSQLDANQVFNPNIRKQIKTKSTIRMFIIFFIYLIPLVIGLISFLNNCDIIFYAMIVFELLFLIYNFIRDYQFSNY